MNLAPELVAAATAGDLAALGQVVEALQRPFYNLALRILANHQDAEEATQEALLRCVTHLGTFRGESRFSTWAWAVASRVVLEQRRRRGAQPLMVADFAADLAEGADVAAVERLEDRLALQQVKVGCGRAMLLCLDDDHRIAYVLGEILEVPGAEVSEALGISHTAYRQRLSRARAAVATNLELLCGVANPAVACRCHRRLRPARALGRLEPRDAEGHLDVGDLQRRIADLQRHAEFYRADPQLDAPRDLVRRVREALTRPPP